MADVYIRKMDREDIDAVYKLEQNIFKKSAWSKNALENKTIHAFILELDGVVIGYIFLRIVAPEAHILNFAVDERFRRRGFGEKLLIFGIDYIKKNNCVEIYLEVRANNASARKLYEKVGFDAIFIRKNYYANNTDAVIYLLKLSL